MSDTAADLDRYFCELYCPQCGTLGADHLEDICNACGGRLLPGLDDRDPRTKVEGLKRSLTGYWVLSDDRPPSIYSRISDARAADLLVQGVVKLQRPQTVGSFMTEVGWLMLREKVSMPEAVAIAYHRMLDAEETNAD